jgi:ribosomal-protein-alanine N-acetyltransferase
MEAMRAIEKQSFPTTWPADSFAREAENGAARYRVALLGEEVVGYVGAWFVLDELHITTIAVDPVLRRGGVARKLLASLLRECVEDGCRWSVLEVRESNEAAIKLYERFGFRPVGSRKKYYENEENALVMWVGSMQGQEFRERLVALL